MAYTSKFVENSLNNYKKSQNKKTYSSNFTNKVLSGDFKEYAINLPTAVDVSKQKYNSYNEALNSVSTFTNDEIKNALKDAKNQSNYYKKQVYDLAKESEIETSNNKNIIKNLGEYRQDSLKQDYNNKYQKPTYQKNNISQMAEKSDNKYEENNEKFDKVVKTNDKYKEYEDYAYRAVPLLQETKNQREAYSKKTNFIDKMIAPFVGGVSNALNNTFLPTSNTYKLANGEIVRGSTKSDLNAQRVMSEVKDSDLFGKIYSSATYSLGNMTPSIVAGAVNPVLGATVMGSNTYKNAYNESLKEGYSEKQANNYAIANTTLELGLGKILGGMSTILGKSGLSNVISKSMSKVLSNKATRDFLAEMGSEFTEEYLQEIIDPFVRNKILGEDNKIKLISEEALIAGLSGALNSGISNYPKFKYNINREKIYTKENVTNLINNQSQNSLENRVVNNAINNAINKNDINSPKINSEINANQNNDFNSYKSKSFDNDFKKFNSGKYNENDNIVLLDNTPDYFYNLGYDSNNPIVINMNKLSTIMKEPKGTFNGKNQHGITKNIIEQLPYAINNPLNVIKNPKFNNRFVLVTELSDQYGDIVIVPIEMDTKGYISNIFTDINRVVSTYGKEHYDGNNNNSFMEANKNNIVYDIDKDITKKATAPRLQLPYANSFNEKLDVKDRLQLPMRDSSSSITTSDIPKNTSPIYYNNDTTIDNKNQVAPLPINNNIQKFTNDTDNINLPLKSDINTNKVLNPIEISNLTLEDVNTTPKLSNINRNKINDGESKFYNNMKDKVGILNEQQKGHILSNEEVKYYDKVTNKETLDKAFKKMDSKYSTEGWFGKESNNADAVDVAQGWILLKQYADNNDADGMVAVAKKMRDIGTKAGQTIQAFNIMERMTPEGMVKYAQSELSEAYDKMVKNKSKEWIDKYRSDFDLKPDEVQFIMDNMKEISKMSDGYDKRVKLAEIQKLMTDKLPPEKGNKIKSWMRISMLFNPKTQVRNVAGNAIIMPVNYFGDLFSSYADKMVSKKTGVRTTGNMNIKAILKGFKEGAYQATNDYKKGINTKDMTGNRFEIGEGKSFNDKKLIGKSLNRVEGLLNYVMDAGDRIFSQSSFENSLQNQMILNNTTEITQTMIDIATQESLSRTWNDNNDYTKFVLGVRNGLNKIGIKGYGLGDILIPFAKTPANLTKAIVDYSPAGLVTTIIEGNNLKKSLTNGQYTPQMQHKFVQSLGKATAGTILYIVGYALAKAGVTSGKSDDDKDVANFLKNTLGISSYSIKIGNKTFTYDWAQPLAAPLSITSNIVNSKNKETALFEAIVGNLDTAGSILLEQSFLESLNDVFTSNEGPVSGIINEILELPSRSVPTFSKQIADMIDGTQRTSYEYKAPLNTAVNSIKAKIPGLSKTLAPTVDTMGREIKKYGGKNNVFNVFLSPTNVNTENISESAEEIYRVYKEVGDKNVMPRVAPYYINKKGEKITFTSNQRAEYQKTSGKIIEDNIKKLLNTNEYKNMTNDKKSEVIKKIVDYSYNIAQKEVLDIELSDTYQKAYNYSKIGNISDYYSFKNSVDNDNKKTSISSYLINSNLSDKQIAYLYGNYYSNEETLNNLLTMNIPIKEFIKLNSEDIQSNYNVKTGKTISGSKKSKVINYVNSLNLTVPQKAILIKSQYNTYKNYDNQIINYVNKIDIKANEKKFLLKSIGFNNYDTDIINYINNQNLTVNEKEKKLKSLGFIVRNGRVYN